MIDLPGFEFARSLKYATNEFSGGFGIIGSCKKLKGWILSAFELNAIFFSLKESNSLFPIDKKGKKIVCVRLPGIISSFNQVSRQRRQLHDTCVYTEICTYAT